MGAGHFRRVIEAAEESRVGCARGGAVGAQKAAQQGSATNRNESQKESRTEVIPVEYAVSPAVKESHEKTLVGPV